MDGEEQVTLETMLEKTELDDCEIWHGSKDAKGYGRKTVRGTTCRLSRLVLTKKLGRPIRPGYLACHSCNNPACFKPDHLYEGTNSDNMKDRVASGHHPVGMKTSGHKLNDSDVFKIRAFLSKGIPAAMVAQTFRVTGALVYMIRSREIWKHLKQSA